MIISEACQKFLGHCQCAVSLSDHTLRAYTSDLRDVETYFGPGKRLKAIDKEGLRQYIRYLRAEREFKETTIKRRVACLKLLFRWGLQESMMLSNPFDTLNERIRLPKRLPRALDRYHTSLLKKAIVTVSRNDDFDVLCRKTAIHLLLETGIRVGELANIRVEDLSLSDRCVMVHGKGNRQRLVYFLSVPLYRSIDFYLAKRKKLLADSEKLFVTETGLELTPHRVRVSLHDIAAAAGIDRHLTPHMLRHTCATQWLESGLDIRYVQKLLGHHSISTTEIYTHVSDQSLREALLRVAGGQIR